MLFGLNVSTCVIAFLLFCTDTVMPMFGRSLQICSIIFLSQHWLVYFFLSGKDASIVCGSCICEKEKQISSFVYASCRFVLVMFKGFERQSKLNGDVFD